LGLTLLERGDLDQATAVIDSVTLIPALLEMPLKHVLALGHVLLEARGRVRLARGQRTQAIADIRHCGHYADSVQATPNPYAWRSALALALAPEHPQETRELAQAEPERAAALVRPARSASRCESAGYSPPAKTASSCSNSPSPYWNPPRCGLRWRIR
jgi:hypothetical protein